MRTARTFVLACAVVGLRAATVAQPLEPAREPHKVAIVATVTDRHQHPVSGLSSTDFEVQDNGHAYVPIAFDAGRWPLSVTVVLDRSDSLSIGPTGVRAAAARFITELQPNDEARLCAFARNIACSPGFTTDHEELALEVRHSVRVSAAGSSTRSGPRSIPCRRRKPAGGASSWSFPTAKTTAVVRCLVI